MHVLIDSMVKNQGWNVESTCVSTSMNEKSGVEDGEGASSSINKKLGLEGGERVLIHNQK